MNNNTFEEYKEAIKQTLMEEYLFPEGVAERYLKKNEDYLIKGFEDYSKDGYDKNPNLVAYALDMSYSIDSTFEDGLEAFNSGCYEEAYTIFFKTAWGYDVDRDCDESNPDSLHYLGIMHIKGIFTEKDVDSGFNFLKQAFEDGGITDLAFIKENMNDIMKDEEGREACKKYLQCIIEKGTDSDEKEMAEKLMSNL